MRKSCEQRFIIKEHLATNAHVYTAFIVFNQVQLARAWFLEITFIPPVCVCVCVCVRVSTPEAINN